MDKLEFAKEVSDNGISMDVYTIVQPYGDGYKELSNLVYNAVTSSSKRYKDSPKPTLIFYVDDLTIQDAINKITDNGIDTTSKSTKELIADMNNGDLHEANKLGIFINHYNYNEPITIRNIEDDAKKVKDLGLTPVAFVLYQISDPNEFDPYTLAKVAKENEVAIIVYTTL